MRLNPKRTGSFVYSAVMFLVVSVAAGALVAGLAVPIAAMAGMGGKAAEDTLDDLPKQFKAPSPALNSKVLLGNGKVLTHFYDQNRTYVKLKNIAPAMRTAQLAIEDHRFYEHGALDVTGTVRAFLTNTASGGVSQGGSSITQQYVKMVRISRAKLNGNKHGVQEAQSDTYGRKIQELKYASALENKYSKNQILERYLNIAYYGKGAYGVQAAAHRYFGTTAKNLTLPQAAMLAGLVQSPDSNNPVDHPTASIKRRNVVLDRMADQKDITKKQAKKAKEAGFDQGKVQSPPRSGCIGSKYPFTCNYIYKSLLKTPSLGKTKKERENKIKRGGLTIKTNINPHGQDKAQQAVSNYIDPKDPVISTMSMIQPGTGKILGMAQNRPKMGNHPKRGETYYNYAATKEMGGSPGGFQSGSTFKAITIAAALEAGIKPGKKYNASPSLNLSGKSFKTCKGHFRPSHYVPENSTGVNGVMNMRKAAKFSVNTYFLQLEKTIGICKVAKMADKLGVKLPNGEKVEDSNYASAPSLTLGVANIAPLSLAQAYATFAARGVRCDPVAIDKIHDHDGKTLKTRGAHCKRVISKHTADQVNSILEGVMSGTGSPAKLSNGRPAAGKTGTTEDNQAVWFAGYTPQVAGVASIAEDLSQSPFNNPQSRPSSGLKHFYLPNSGRTLEGSGGGDAGRGIWKPAMQTALRGKPKKEFAGHKKYGNDSNQNQNSTGNQRANSNNPPNSNNSNQNGYNNRGGNTNDNRNRGNNPGQGGNNNGNGNNSRGGNNGNGG